MIASETFFSALVWGAVAITVAGPFVLLGLLWRDWRAGKLW
jgi:hypothetical protein